VESSTVEIHPEKLQNPVSIVRIFTAGLRGATAMDVK